jgi:hypothetical protein
MLLTTAPISVIWAALTCKDNRLSPQSVRRVAAGHPSGRGTLAAIGENTGRRGSPRRGRKPAHWTAIDRDYETLRIGMQTLFHDLGIATQDAAAA